MTRNLFLPVAILAVVAAQLGSVANREITDEAAYRAAWAQRFANPGVRLAADGGERRTLVVATYAPNDDTCDQTLNQIIGDSNFTADIQGLGFTTVERIARDERLQIVSSEVRVIAPRKPWRKRAEV